MKAIFVLSLFVLLVPYAAGRPQFPFQLPPIQLPPVLQNAGAAIQQTAQNIGADIQKTAQNIGAGVQQTAQNVGADIQKTAQNVGADVQQTVQNIGAGVQQTAQNLGAGVQHPLTNLVNGIKQQLEKLADAIKQKAETLITGITHELQTLLTNIKPMVDTLKADVEKIKQELINDAKDPAIRKDLLDILENGFGLADAGFTITSGVLELTHDPADVPGAVFDFIRAGPAIAFDTLHITKDIIDIAEHHIKDNGGDPSVEASLIKLKATAASLEDALNKLIPEKKPGKK